MTADELIRQLKTPPSDTRILVEGYETGCDDIEELHPLEVFRYSRAQEWDGQYQTDTRFRPRDEKSFPAVMIRGRRGPLRERNNPASLKKTNVARKLDVRYAPYAGDVQDRENAPMVSLEQLFMDETIDIRAAILLFAEKVSQQFNADRIILFGSQARDYYRSQSDADVAVILRGAPGSFLENKLALAGIAYDVMLETDAPIQAHPIWTAEWDGFEGFSSPTRLKEIQQEGITLWLQEDTESYPATLTMRRELKWIYYDRRSLASPR